MQKKLKSKNFILINENCLNAFKEIPSNSIDFIATDPPYFLEGMGSDWSDKKLFEKAGRAKAIGGLPVGMKFDPNQGKRLESFFRDFSKEAIRVLKPGGFMVSFAQGRLFHRMAVAIEDSGFEIRDMLTWEHGGGQGKAFSQNHFIKKLKILENEKNIIMESLQGKKTPQLRPKFEPIVLAQKPKEGTFVQNWMKWKTGLVNIDFEDGQQTTILKYKKPQQSKQLKHMTIKPVDLMEKLIEIFTIKNQKVLDPFLGTGTTGVAAINKNRKFIGFEIEKKYFNIAYNRIKNL